MQGWHSLNVENHEQYPQECQKQQDFVFMFYSHIELFHP